MASDRMRAALPLLAIALALAGCKAKPAKPADEAGQPQVATSIEDLALPTDKSDQITAIDAATSDASGMPRDGGAVVQAPKRAAPAIVQAPAPDAPPVEVVPAKPALTVENVPATN